MNSSNAPDHIPTERLQSAEAVQLALAAYDASLNGIISMQAIRSRKGKVVDFLMLTANRAVERILQMPPEKIIGTRLLETFPGNGESGMFSLYERVVETGQAEQIVEHYTDVYGLQGWFEVSAVRSELDQLVITFINVTDSKQAELKIKQQADLLQAVLDHTQAAISLHEAIRDETGKIVDFHTILANQQAIRMWGDLAEAILTKRFFEVASPEQQQIDFAKYVHVVETGEPDLSEFSIGDQWWLRLTTRSGDGVVISNVDITENQRNRLQVEATNLELKRSNENLQSFAYIASHDLQEPLRKIQSFGDILRSQYASQLSQDGVNIVERMQVAAERMSLLIRDLLDYSRITTQRETFRSFSLAKLIEDITEDLWHPIEQTQATIQLGAHNELPEIVGDRLQLRLLFQNLLSNALKFYRKDADGVPVAPVVQITAQKTLGSALPPAIATILSARRTYWTIAIADNGIGFDSKYADQIFQVFQRLHARHEFSGTGIGLAIVKKVIEQHDGAIDVQSQIGEGTTFTVYLPV
ncbi:MULTISPECIES: ATP-binding protein [unclassified Spirosoma]|uniref:sensor histidine kinase n=1 Tax=unclassified Spirosoma TaxID=2621999 RepID=UPI000967F814|nr:MULTISPECIES: ATP-binding protein [unclassified Spirosoma]MBN8826943.1 PAS domain-containing protein [Spirosoma sp.]OJW70672.1 MAG: histidine kinase [Spirosoma sp. 48-14]